MNRPGCRGRPGGTVDWRRDDGGWFDRDELHQIVKIIGTGGLPDSPARRIDAIRQETDWSPREQRRLYAIARMAGPSGLPTAGWTALFFVALRRIRRDPA